MKKGLLAVLLCVLMAMALLSATAFAAVDDLIYYTTTDTVPVVVTLCVLTDPVGDDPGTVQVGDGFISACNADVTSVTLPEVITDSGESYKVTTVGAAAFSKLTELQSVSLPGVTDIGQAAFNGCIALNSIDIPKVTNIGILAFYNCNSLQSVTLLEVTTIGDDAFSYSDNLTTVNLPNVQIIGSNAFSGCTSLQSVTIWQTSAPTLENHSVFSAVPLACTLYIPDGARDYTETYGWPFSFSHKVSLWPVTGAVYNADGNAAANATVSVYGISTKTDSSGAYTVYVKPDNSADITASITGASEKSITVSYVTGALSDQHIYFGKVAAPTFTPAEGTYTGTKSVEISCDTPGATIYYTDNGDEPTASSALYSAPIAIDSTTTLKAKAFKTGLEVSDTASATYTITDNATSVWIAGQELTSTSPYYHNGENGAPGYADSNETDFNAYFDAADGTLTLNGLLVVDSMATQEIFLPIGEISSAYAIFAEGDLTICVDGDSSVSVAHVQKTDADAFSLALYVSGDLTVQPGDTGSGSLTAEAKGATSRGSALCSGVTSKTLEVKSGAEVIGIVSGDSSATGVFNAGVNTDAVTVTGGTLKGIASGEVICETGLNNYAISCGIMVNYGALSLSAGSIEATGGKATGADSATSFGVAMTRTTDSINITGGSFTAKSGTASTTVAVQNPLTLGSGVTAKGSTSSDGSGSESYVIADNANYKWVSVVPTPTVASVAVNPASVSIQKGGTQTFNAIVFGANDPAQTVTWAVTGGVSGTSIDEDGVLTVAANETAAMLTVKATSTVDTKKLGVANVTVTTPAPVEYQITRGANGEWTKGGSAGLGFTADGNYADFTGVSVDGTAISSDKYTSASGSTVVTLKASYLETLSAGRHALRVSFTDGYTETHFTIAATPIPATGDDSHTLLWLGIALLAGAGLTASLVLGRRKRKNG